MSTCHFSLQVHCQPTISTPSSPCLQCHDGSYISLSALQCLNCQAKPNCFRLQSQGHQCKRPSSPTVPAHYRTSGVQLLTSYLQTTQISHLTHAACNPILSWTKVIDKAKIWPSRFPCHSFSFSLPPPGMTPGSVAPRTVHSVRPGSTTTWPTCRDVHHFLWYFSVFFSMLSSDSPGSLCQNHQAFLVTLQDLSAKVT